MTGPKGLEAPAIGKMVCCIHRSGAETRLALGPTQGKKQGLTRGEGWRCSQRERVLARAFLVVSIGRSR